MKSTLHTKVSGVVLAAGRGKRMNSMVPKVLHQIKGRTLLGWVVTALKGADVENICLVLPPDLSPFASFLELHRQVSVCVQKTPNGTAGALASAYSFFSQLDHAPPYCSPDTLRQGKSVDDPYVLICNGDTPAIKSQVLKEFIQFGLERDASLVVMGVVLPDPKGYGRLVFSADGCLERIVEEKDTDDVTRKITACNAGILFGKVSYIFSLLDAVDSKNAQQEFYLTDCVKLALERQQPALAYVSKDWQSLVGVNDQEQLKAASALLEP